MSNKEEKEISSIFSNDEIIDVIQHYAQEYGVWGKTADEASKTIIGSMNMTKAAWSNLITGLSKDGADVDKLIDNLINSALKFAENIMPVIMRAIEGISKALPKIADYIGKELPGLVDKLLPPLIEAINSLLNALITALPGLLNTLIPLLTQTLLSLIQSLTSYSSSLISNVVTENLSSALSFSEFSLSKACIFSAALIAFSNSGVSFSCAAMAVKISWRRCSKLRKYAKRSSMVRICSSSKEPVTSLR